jgi:hypothetical protein
VRAQGHWAHEAAQRNNVREASGKPTSAFHPEAKMGHAARSG